MAQPELAGDVWQEAVAAIDAGDVPRLQREQNSDVEQRTPYAEIVSYLRASQRHGPE